MFRHVSLYVLFVMALLKTTVAEQPTALELLDKYAENQEKLQSVIIKYEKSSENESFYRKRPQQHVTGSKWSRVGEFRYDGERAYNGCKKWPEDNEAEWKYRSYLWDGKEYFQFEKSDKQLGLLSIYSGDSIYYRGKNKALWGRLYGSDISCRIFPGSNLRGFLDRDVERVDSIFRKASKITVSDEMAVIGGSKCYVLMGKVSSYGKYKLWLDPEHGYNIAKAEVRKAKGDRYAYKVIRSGGLSELSLDNVRFEKIDDVWVPMEVDEQTYQKYYFGDFYKIKSHYRNTEVVLNPDHEALGSFVLNDAPNGAAVRIRGVNDIDYHVEYTWQDGEVVDANGKKVDSGINKAGAENMPSASDLLDKYTHALDSTNSFINHYEQSTEFSYRHAGFQDEGEAFTRGQVRHDDQRVYFQQYIWGDFNPKYKDLPEDKPYYSCNIVDAKNKFLYQNNKWINRPDRSGSALRQPDQRKEHSLSRIFGVSYVVGYIGSDQRLDGILRKANNISVRGATENIRGSECFVIEADTKCGHYSVWLDSEHGFHPAKVRRSAKGGDYTHGRLMSKGGTALTYLDTVRFEKVDGIWVPMEANSGCDRVTPEGYFVKDDYHYKRTQITLNPDHDKLGSFADPILEDPNNDPELVNGTRVRLNNRQIEYIWRDGELTAKRGADVKP